MMMREAFGNTIAELMRKDERICVLDADLANCNGTAGLRKEFPERAFDVGIAEQNMASVAAGLSSYGFIPFISSFTPFATRRICDQIAISIAYAKQNVKIVGSDPGISAQRNGGTHMSMEDIGVLRSIPTMVIFEPVDNEQMIQALPQIADYNGPVYIRMFRKEVPDVFGKDYKFDLFKADTLKEGKDVTIFASGIMVKTSLDVAEKLKSEGIDVEVINIHTIKPIDSEAVIKSLKKTKCAVVAENHNIIGGLFSAVSEVAVQNCPAPIVPIGVKDSFGEVGNLDELAEKFEMTEKDVVAAVKKAVAAK